MPDEPTPGSSLELGLVPAARTPGQRAHAMMREMIDGITARTGRSPVSLKPVALVKLLTPFLAQYDDDSVRDALRELWKQGRPIIAVTIEAQLHGREQTRHRSTTDKLREIVFDENGNLA